MPWCDDCAKYWNPPSLTPEGKCPTCGLTLAEAKDVATTKAPWHFKLLLGSISIYLAYRAWQGIEWVAHHV